MADAPEAGYTDLEQLAGVPEAAPGRLHGMGPEALPRVGTERAG
jgi:hypothetical protein